MTNGAWCHGPQIGRATIAPLAAAALALACESDPVTPGTSAGGDALAPTVTCDAVGVAGTPYVPGVNCRTVDVDGYPREYLVYVPPGHVFTDTAPAPVVLMFHGGSQTGARFYHISRWREKADSVGLLAVFPNGLRYFILEDGRWTRRWNTYDLPAEMDPNLRLAGYPADAPWPADDVGFVRAMLDDLESVAHADPERLYATGFSDGAAFTARLAVEATDRLAAFAYAAGRFCDAMATNWSSASPPRPAFMVLGSVDPKILGDIYAADSTALSPLSLDPDTLLAPGPVTDCLASPVQTFDLAWEPYDVRTRAGEAQIEWSTPLGTDRGQAFRFSVVAGLGHRYPNGGNNPLGWVAADRFWTFFRQRRLTN